VAGETSAPAAIEDELVALLKERGPEIEDALIARLRGSELWANLDAETISKLRPAAVEVVAGIAGAVEQGGQWSPALSPAMVDLIRSLAANGGSLEGIARGFTLGSSVFIDFIAAELGGQPRAEAALRYAVDWQSRNGDQLVKAFVAEYEKEVERLERAPSRQLKQRVVSLLAGGSGAYTDLGYRLDGCHVGVIAIGARAELECRALAESLGCDLLSVPCDEGRVWAWFGSPRQIEIVKLARLAEGRTTLSLAAGEPRRDLEGWRLTHEEARATLPVALLEPAGFTRYSDVALVADALQNEAACKSLIDRYLEPWNKPRDGERLRTTVRAYLDLDCNAASTASALGVNRHTVQRRLKRVEEAIGEPLSARRAELDVALRIERLTARAAQGDPLGQG
jgi:hypothetical protein